MLITGKLLLTGAAVLKYFSKGFPFFHSRLVPWKHFVPIKRDLSDLLEARDVISM